MFYTRLDITGVYKDYTFFGVDIDDMKAKRFRTNCLINMIYIVLFFTS